MNDELHIAVALNHLKEVESLLTQDHNLVNEIDLKGDQPLHIAAQSDCSIDIVKILIQYDAPIGRRNYEGLTPLGVARFHSQKEIVDLLNRYYEVVDGYVGEEPEKYKYERVDIDSIPSQALIRKLEQEARTQQARLDWIDWWRHKKEHESAILIQQIIRQYLAEKYSERMEIKRINAIKIQHIWNEFMCRKRQNAAITIQSFQRMVLVKSYFTSFQRERLYWHRASRILASLVQRLWRGHKGRSQTRRLREIKNLSNPSDALKHDEWVKHQEEAYPPSRTWNMYSEFVLSGKPRSWQGRRIKRNGYFKDVIFWVNNLTQQASFTQPARWRELDKREYNMRQQVLKLGYTLAQNETACKLQLIWRARVAKRNLSLILRAHRVMNKAIDVYYTDPNNLVALCNYTLYIHAIKEDKEQTMSLYEHCLTRMKEKGNDNAFILYGYAIFLARIGIEYDDFASQAQSVETRYQKRNGTKKSLYLLPNEIFRFATNDKQTGSSWHNYALCRMIAFRDYAGSKASFLKAMKLSPTDKILLQNFNKLLRDNSETGDAFDEFREAQSFI